MYTKFKKKKAEKSKSKKKTSKSKKKCFKCKKFGHYANRCWNKETRVQIYDCSIKDVSNIAKQLRRQ